MKVFKRENFEACSPFRALTSVETFEDGRAKLRIHKDRKKDYLSWWQSDLKVSKLIVRDLINSDNILFDCSVVINESFAQDQIKLQIVKST